MYGTKWILSDNLNNLSEIVPEWWIDNWKINFEAAK